MIIGTSLDDLCRVVNVRNNMITWTMLCLMYTTLQTS